MTAASIMPIVYIVLVGLIVWWVAERFSPDPLITKIVQAVVFVVVIGAVLSKLL